MEHWSQFILTGELKKYDYGSETENMKYYNSLTPPFYNISNIETPVHLFVGNTD